jgi:hypothetical protein
LTFLTRLFVSSNVVAGTALTILLNPDANDGEKNGFSATLSLETNVAGVRLDEKLTFIQSFYENNGNMLARNVGGFQLDSGADYLMGKSIRLGGGFTYMSASNSYSSGSASKQRGGIFFRTGYDF